MPRDVFEEDIVEKQESEEEREGVAGRAIQLEDVTDVTNPNMTILGDYPHPNVFVFWGVNQLYIRWCRITSLHRTTALCQIIGHNIKNGFHWFSGFQHVRQIVIDSITIADFLHLDI